ncbi:protein kinase [Streptomyces cavernae]|uniref:protein kinase n=1 Tax=Streptomyces cavernae TaxID=2259034 RepID=UPI000FEBE00A|nr:protein kinase [Streptomyces cavernae]
MDDYAGRVLADRYRLPLPPSDEYEFAESRAFDTYSGQEVLVRQVPLPEILEAEVLDADGLPEGFVARDAGARRPAARTTRRPTDPAVRRAIEAAQAAAQIPDHPRLDQVFDVFAEGGSLWIVSELVAARPLAALLAEKPLSPYRAAEVAADVLTALRALHAHGWVHRNITARTVLVCDDGRVMLTGLAAGAAEEALCGYDPVPDPAGPPTPGDTPRGPAAEGGAGPAGPGSGGVPAGFGSGGVPPVPGGTRGPGGAGAGGPGLSGRGGASGAGPGGAHGVVTSGLGGAEAEAARRAAIEARALDTTAGPNAVPNTSPAAAAGRALDAADDVRAARAGAIAAYRAGARAAARVHGEQQSLPQLPGQSGPNGRSDQGSHSSQGGQGGQGGQSGESGQNGESVTGRSPHGQIADPYGVGTAKPWHGALPRNVNGSTTGIPGITAATSDDARTANGSSTPTQGRPSHPGTPMPGRPTAGTHQPGAPIPHTPMPGTPAPGSLSPGMPTPNTPAPYGNGAGQLERAGDAPTAPAPYGSEAPSAPGAARWDHVAPASAPRRGPTTALAAERARQARMAVVGPVTERWAPEQAGPVHENWQLAAPIGPATDLWALGALLFRAVQGHAPYPEENTAELVELVVSEPPAFAEECGPLRPVVESLLRQDPTERLDFEELRGWLRSLVRSAPEPEAGSDVVVAPPVDPSRLPIVRRRGELVRKRRAGLPATSGRHKRARKDERKPKRLGRNLVLLILLALAAAIAYAMVFMPKAEPDGSGRTNGDATGTVGEAGPAPSRSAQPDTGTGGTSPEATPGRTSEEPTKNATETQTNELPQGFSLRRDPEGFEVAVAKGWNRQPKNARGQVIYYQGNFELILVPGRDSTKDFSGDPMTYQRESEPELQPFRDSTWATSSGMRRIDVGGRTMAEGQFTWTNAEGKELFVRNLAILVGGRYHVVQLRGPEAERDEVTRLYEQASATYRTT